MRQKRYVITINLNDDPLITRPQSTARICDAKHIRHDAEIAKQDLPAALVEHRPRQSARWSSAEGYFGAVMIP